MGDEHNTNHEAPRLDTGGSRSGESGSGEPEAPTMVRTYQEVDFLKEIIGSTLISGLTELCIHRPSDPIEYLGHWLIRHRFNEELRKQDTKNAFDLVQTKEWTKYREILGFTSSGFTPENPYGPVAYGGPLFGDSLEALKLTASGAEVVDKIDKKVVEALYKSTELYGEVEGEDEDENPAFDQEQEDEEHIPVVSPSNEQVYQEYFGEDNNNTGPYVYPDANSAGDDYSVMSMRQVQERRNTRGRNETIALHPENVPAKFRHSLEGKED